MVDALGNPLAFLLTPGQAHDLDGADVLLPQMQADTLLADKAFDADKRVIEPLLRAGKTALVRKRVPVDEGEQAEAVAEVAGNELIDQNMRPGDVKQHG